MGVDHLKQGRAFLLEAIDVPLVADTAFAKELYMHRIEDEAAASAA